MVVMSSWQNQIDEYNYIMKVNLKQIKKQSKAINTIVAKTRKMLFELEIMQSTWESDHGLGKVYKSADDLIAAIHKKTLVYL